MHAEEALQVQLLLPFLPPLPLLPPPPLPALLRQLLLLLRR